MARSAGWVERFARAAAEWSGGTAVFAIACLIVLVWPATGPIFGFSDTWQLIINTGTTVITFLMVFLIQRSQNKDAVAMHLKLNEITASLQGASNRLINVEDMTENDLLILHEHYGKLAALAKEDAQLTESHSVEEATARHKAKLKRSGRRPKAGR